MTEAPTQRWQDWLERRDWDEGTLLLVVGGAIGVVSGLGVVAFYRLIDLAHLVLIAWPGAHLPGPLRFLYWPLLTSVALWTAWFVVRRSGVPEGQNVPDVQLAVAKHDARVPMRPVAVRTLASAITLGGGGSAGSEGPTAVLGAGIGSALARRLRIRPRHRKVLVGCGAAAGIAAAFNAPFAGAFFALEEVLGTFSVGAFSPVVIASVAGALTIQTFVGAHPIFHLPHVPETHAIANALLYPLLGLACGVASALHARAYLAAPAFVDRTPGPAWLRPVLGGLIVGGIVAASGGLLAGNGHLAIPTPIFGQMAWWALILIALAKIAATALTLAAGGSGGVFTPTLFIGAALGGGAGVLASQLVPGDVVQPHAWALVGMAGLVAGATRAPLTAIFMVFEMTNDTSYIVPLIIVSVVSLLTARRLAPHGLYDGWLAQRGEHLAHGVDQAVMDRLHVGATMDRGVPTVVADASLDEVLQAAGATAHAFVPVLDAERHLIGLASHHQLREALLARGAMGGLLIAADMAEAVEPMRPDQTLREALAALNARGLDAVPVVNPDGTFAGLLTRASVLKSYERALSYVV
ncbi:MAG TPA: chloride channel protein [Gemmatimonadaceae bacterium]